MVTLGEQPSTRVSEVLNTVNFGIATSPYGLLGKSATVAAMFEHGLPVIVNREDGPAAPEDPRDQPDHALVIRLGHDFARRLASAKRGEPCRRLPAAAAQFLADLEAGAAS
jgi:hypothetical protein